MAQSIKSRVLVTSLMMMLAGTFAAGAQTPVSPPVAPPKAAPTQGTELDRVVAIVNGDLILDSDVDEERRFEDLQPYRDTSVAFSRDKAIERLINRDLILQQAQLQPQDAIPDEAVQKELDNLRKTIPECKRADCASKAGWDKYLAQNGFTEASLLARWRTRMEVLRFIEQRFRMGIKITPEEINAYYTKTMLPEYARQKDTPPALSMISDRIQEVLLQQRVSNLLSDWLQSLRAQGSVVVLHAGEVAP